MTRKLPFDRIRSLAWVVFVAAIPVFAFGAPASTQMTLTDSLGVGWTNELVHASLTFPARQLFLDTACVTRPDRAETPSQITDVTRFDDGSIRSMNVWFFADVPANGSATYKIQPGAKSKPHTGMTVVEKNDSLTLTTKAPKSLGVRLLGGSKTFVWPVSLDDSFVPIQALLMPSGHPVGEGRFENVPFRLKSYQTRMTAYGPLFADVEIRYIFDAGYWNFKVRVLDGCPMIQINEEFNTGASDLRGEKFDRFYSITLNTGGFKPAQGWFTQNNPLPEFCDLAKQTIPDSWTKTGALPSGISFLASPVNGYTLQFDADRDNYYLTGWPSVIAQVGCFIRFVQPGGDAIGFANLDIMGWRNAEAIRFRTTQKGELRVNLPLQKFVQDWKTDGFGDGSPNYTGKTLYVPPNTCRRSYGILLSAAENETEHRLESLTGMTAHLAAEPLETVKNWTFDWPDPMADAKWTDKPTEAGSKAVEILRGRTRLDRLGGDLVTFSMGNHFVFSKQVFPQIEKVINDPAQITADQRKELRRLAAFEAYRQNSLALFPYGTGVHLNNPNMTIMACEARARSALLVKDHPMFTPWGQVTLGLMRDYFARYIKPRGAPFECPHYTLGVTMDWAAIANQALREAGIGDAFDTDLFHRAMQFMLNWVTPPDPRFNGHRVIVPFGNTSYQSVPPSFGEAFVGYYETRDPKLAGEIQWFANQTLPADKQIHRVQEVRPDLRSGWFPEYGVVFRHGFGTEYETMMHLLAGSCVGHYENESDQMAYTLYAKGQPINLHFGNGYFPMFNRPWLRNRISFGKLKMEAPERNPIEVNNATFSPEVEYVHATRETNQLLPMFTEYPLLDAKGLQWSPQENENWARTISHWDDPSSMIPMTVWHRQLLFLKDSDPKGPNYFVLRDTFGGVPSQDTDLSLWFLANKMTETNDVFHFDGQCKVDMDVFVNTPARGRFQPHTDKYGHSQHPYVRLTGFDPKYFPGGTLSEEQLLLRIPQPPGGSYMVVLYPRLKENDPPATYERLADSVVRVETPLSTDFVFADYKPVTFRNDQMSFTGRTGAVRQYKSGKIRVVNSDGPCEVTIAGKTISGQHAFVVEIEKGSTRVTWQEDGASASVQ